MFLRYVHSFRAVAILFVVAGHCMILFDWGQVPRQHGVISSVITNGTVLFVFVAGFLFQHLSGRFDYRRYLTAKIRNVLLPYLIICAPIIVFQAFTREGPFDPGFSHYWPAMWQNAVWGVLTGRKIQGTFWFIPMIFVFYLLAPLWLWIDRRPRFYCLLPVLLVVAALSHRPYDQDYIWQSCTYFLPVYLYGMWFSHYRERVEAWHGRWLPALIVLLAVLVWLEMTYQERPGAITSLTMFSTENGVLDLNIMQKVLLCGVLLVVMKRAGDLVHDNLSYISEVSFGIYLLHVALIDAFIYLANGYKHPLTSTWAFWQFSMTVVILCTCLFWAAGKALRRERRGVAAQEG